MFAKTSLAALIGAAAVFTATSAAASWTLVGDTVALPNGGHTLTTAGLLDDDGMGDGALNLSGNDTLMTGWALENALGFAPGAFDIDPDLLQSTEGSGMFSLITVQAGQTLSFEWQIATRDVGEGFGLDYAFVAIGDTLFTLGTAAMATLPGNGSYLAQTAWQTFSHTFAQGGTYRVALGVVDVLDYVGSTALSVGTVSAVPEPETIAMLLAGLGLIGGVARRRVAGAATSA